MIAKWPFSETGQYQNEMGAARRSYVASSVNEQDSQAGKPTFDSGRFKKGRNVKLASLGDSRTIAVQANSMSENRTVLYRKGQQVDGGYYIVEISTLPD